MYFPMFFPPSRIHENFTSPRIKLLLNKHAQAYILLIFS